MGQIYRKASTVLVWLGEAADDSDILMDHIPTLGPLLQQIPRSSSGMDFEEVEPLLELLPVPDHPVWKALVAFSSRA